MTTPTSIYRAELCRLMREMGALWPEIPVGNPVDAALWLLTHLRRIEDSGVLPAITDTGELIRTVRDQQAVERMLREEDEL